MKNPDLDFSRLLDTVYQAALEPSRWPDVLKATADWFGASRALLFTPNKGLESQGFFYAHGVSAEEMTIWSSGHVGKDFWTSRVIERGLAFEGSILLDSDLSSRQELVESDYYRNHLTRMQIGRLLGCIVRAPPDKDAAVVGLSLYRRDDEAPFDEHSRQRMVLLLPHLSRSLGVMYRLREADIRASSGAAALDALSFGVATLDARGLVVQANTRALAILGRADGLACVDDRLQLHDGASDRLWQSALQATLSEQAHAGVAHFSERLRAPRTPGDAHYLLQLSRLPATTQFGALRGGARAIVFITEAQQLKTPDAPLLMRLYKLTATEAKCAVALEGDRVKEAADKLGMSPHTLKSHLKQIYAKTGCASRADLTRLLLSVANLA